MPITQTTFLRTSAALLILGFVALVGIVGSTVWLVERVQYYFDAVIEARAFRTSTNMLRIALQQVESSQRGFVLTQEEPYLVPYNDARDDIMPLYNDLKEVVRGHQQYVSEVDALEQPLQQKLTELEETISLV